MARLNTTNAQATRSSPQRKQPVPKVRQSLTDYNEENTPAVPKSSKQRQKKGSGTMFEIFSDDQLLESTRLEADGAPQSTSPTKKKRTLNLARTNSLLLPVQQRPRQRPNFKLEADDYDKENDLTEYGTDSYSAATSPASHQSPVGRSPIGRSPIGRSTTPVPVRNQAASRPMSYLSPEAAEYEDSGDESFDSLDDFIVSDNDEISYISSTASTRDSTPDFPPDAAALSEEECQKPSTPPSPPKSTRRRLIRGRRPGFQNEGSKNRDRSPNNYLPLDVKVPDSIRVSSSPYHVSDDTEELSTRLRALAVDETVKDKDQPKPNRDTLPHRRPTSSHRHPTSSRRSSSACSHSPDSFPDLVEAASETPTRRPKSPTKPKTRIPHTPHRESSDEFWSQEITSAWIDQHSPAKPLFKMAPKRELDNPDNEGSLVSKTKTMTIGSKPMSKTAIKKAEVAARKAEKALKQEWEDTKHGLATMFIRELDNRVNNGQVAALSTGGFIPIEWTSRFQTTAGQASKLGYQIVKSDQEGVPDRVLSIIKIELSNRAITDMYRLTNTLLHEYCHLADFVLDGANSHHGRNWQAWGQRCIQAIKGSPVYGKYDFELTKRHSYDIPYKYHWTCETCGKVHGRHSKSIDPEVNRCASCPGGLGPGGLGGLLVQTKPTPRKVAPKPPGTVWNFQKKKKAEDVTEVSQ